MQVQLTREQRSFVNLGVEEGRFSGPEEAVRQALALWEKHERARVELLASLDLAERSLDDGAGESYDGASLQELVRSIELRGIKRLAGS